MKQKFKLYVKKIIKKETDRMGRTITYTKWFEVPESSIGSLKKCNDVVEFMFAPENNDDIIGEDFICHTNDQPFNLQDFGIQNFNGNFNNIFNNLRRMLDGL